MFKRNYKKISAILLAAAMTFSLGAVQAAAQANGLPETQKLSFTATDLDGNEVTEKIFSEKDVTMVNIWGTFCSPCVSEMPDLAEISDSMPENQQMVGLVIDVTDESDPNYELAKKVLENADATFTQIIANDDFNELLYSVTGVPTTIFVDKEGRILGDPIVGNNVEEYKKRLEKYAKKYPVEENTAEEENLTEKES
ncbi:MAG: TlpA disulfide reductase family protein [Eubacteriales bacterium]|nr:TlpA disulfide reductase family protein [Eubacteriales bacterium]